METTRKALVTFGALGGLTVGMVSIVVNSDGLIEIIRYTGNLNLPYLLGLCIRFLALSSLGAILVLVNGNGVSSVFNAYQIGMSGPGLLSTVVAGTSNKPVHSAVGPHAYADPYPLSTLLHYAAETGSAGASSSAARELARGIGISADAFPLVFACVLGMTMFSAVISVYLASRGADTQRINTVIETYSTTWKLGFGAIIGLLSGKAFG